MEQEYDGDTNNNLYTWNNPQMISKETRKLRNQMTCRNRPDNSITQIDQNTEKGPGELKRLTVTQTPVCLHMCACIFVHVWVRICIDYNHYVLSKTRRISDRIIRCGQDIFPLTLDETTSVICRKALKSFSGLKSRLTMYKNNRIGHHSDF